MTRSKILARAGRCGGLMLTFALLGCTSARTYGEISRENLARELRARGLPPSVAADVTVTPEMTAWAAARVAKVGSAEVRLQELLAAILSRPEAPFKYVADITASVQEAWKSGHANCLAFSHVFVGLARELGLAAYYLRVRDFVTFDREGDLVVTSDHVTAAFGPTSNRLIMDFSDRPVVDYRIVEPISDLTALALHYSNLGAERIRAGDLAGARPLLELAVRLDPELEDGWVNLGVARRRLGDVAGAETAYRRALEVNPSAISAYRNLSTLLNLLGRTEEAEGLMYLADKAGALDPWSYVALGDVALKHSRLPEAERFFRRAVRLDGDNAEAWAALGEWALAAGKRQQAQSYLERAQRLAAANARVRGLSARLREPS